MSADEVRSTSEIDFDALTDGAVSGVSSAKESHPGTFTPSPRAWEDLVLYFLLPDRFSDGNETDYLDNAGARVTKAGTPRYTAAMKDNIAGSAESQAKWREAGKSWCGGTLAGLTSKLGYLARMGVSAIWVAPVLKQVAGFDTYHGYAIQDFLQVDPNFGKKEDLRTMVRTAHAHGIYVVLDVVINHAANVFEYAPDRYWTPTEGGGYFDARWDGRPYAVKGFYDAHRQPMGSPLAPLPADASLEAAVWPAELQSMAAFHRAGHIQNWDYDPEYREGDFLDLKDLDHGSGAVDRYAPSAALDALCRCYCHWIAYADLDGFRVDTVKHVDSGAVRYFTSWIHEFAQRIGKDNFYVIAEIAQDRTATFEKVELTGLDAALGIADVRDAMGAVARGYADPEAYFGLFRNSRELGKESHAWFRDKVVTMSDDHDRIGQSPKMRFCAGEDGAALVLNVLALNATTLGIPCIYYGTEQGFDGQGGEPYADRYIREAMFGGGFGAFRSRGAHFFDESGRVYVELAKILAERRARPALRRGRQYLRPISGDGSSFGLPTGWGNRIQGLVGWSRILDDTEILCVMNTDPRNASTAWVTLAPGLHPAGGGLRCCYSTDAAQIGQTSRVEARNGTAARVTVPAAGFALFE